MPTVVKRNGTSLLTTIRKQDSKHTYGPTIVMRRDLARPAFARMPTLWRMPQQAHNYLPTLIALSMKVYLHHF